MGSILRVFNVYVSGVLSWITQRVKSEPATVSKIVCMRLCVLIKLYDRFLKYVTMYNYTFLSIFADEYIESGKKSYHLMRRNYVRIGKPGKIGSFIILMMKWVIILSGVCLTLVLTIYPKYTIAGQLTAELTGVSGTIVFSFIISWFVGEVFGGALEVSLNTVLLSAACDEEMFAREQRFIEADLLEFMDGIGEEQNQYHKENKYKIRVGSTNTNDGRASYDDSNDKYGFSTIVPDNSWKNSSNPKILNSSMKSSYYEGSRKVTPGYQFNSKSGSNYETLFKINPGYDLSNKLDNIDELSNEEEPQIVYGRPALHVDDLE
jgi:Plasma-membrane choline transporter